MKYFSLTVLFTLLFSINFLIAQGIQGKAYYQTKTTVDIDFENSRIPPDRIERVKEMMKKQGEKVYELSFTNAESIYKEEEQLDQPGNNSGRRMRFFGSMAGGKVYKNSKTKEYYQEQNLMGKEFLIADSLKMIDWHKQDETKMIGQYLCFKATAKQTVNTDIFRFGRRPSPSDEKIDPPKEVQVIAWYTLDIPVNQGPSKFWGLPGLILEVSAGNLQIVCNKITINPKDKIEVKAPTKGKKVSQDEYDKIRQEKMKEMQENRGRSGGGGGRRP